jgi:hypothetical protein
MLGLLYLPITNGLAYFNYEKKFYSICPWPILMVMLSTFSGKKGIIEPEKEGDRRQP